MKNLLSIVLIAGVLFSCNTPKKEEQKQSKEQVLAGITRFEELKGYFVKNTVAFNDDVEFVRDGITKNIQVK